MAAPAFKSSGAGGRSTGGSAQNDTSGGSVAIGDLLIFQVLQDGTESITPTVDTAGTSGVEDLDGTDDDFTILGPYDVGSPVAGRQWLAIGRSITSTTAAFSMTYSGGANDLYSRVYVFSGANAGTTLNDILENSSAGNVVNGADTSTTIADTGVTTTGADRLALNFVAVNDDNALDAFTGESGGDWTEAVAEYADAGGTDGAIGLQTATIASAGTINGGTDTMAASDAWGVVGFALIPVASGPTEHFGSAAVPLTVSIATNGVRTRFGSAAIPLVATFATNGVRTRLGSLAVPLVVTLGTAGFKTTAGTLAVPLSATFATAGFKSTTSSAAVPLVVTFGTAGFKTTTSSAAVPLVVTFGTAGARELFGAAAVPLVVTFFADGTTSKGGSAALGLTAAIATAGFKTTAGTLAVPLVVTFGTAGFKSTTGSAAVPLVLTFGTAGFKTTTSSAAVPLVVTIFVDGDIVVEEATALFRTLLGVGI